MQFNAIQKLLATRPKTVAAGLCLLLAGITLAVYWPARHYDLIYYDDPYFMEADVFEGGSIWVLTKWVLVGLVAANWHPVTNLSFLAVHLLWGVNPGAEHLLNVMVHAANAALLFLVLQRLTGATWRSVMVAGIFAWHPQRVESVAWISERKDVLFMFFMLLSLYCYAGYAKRRQEKPMAAAGGKDKAGLPPRRWWNKDYFLALVFFVLSFMSKAMVVTLPCLLLLLDAWPLRRWQKATAGKLLIEKIPFFALTIIFCGLTYGIQSWGKAVATLGQISLGSRWENVTLSYAHYLGHFVWPVNLATIYPYTGIFDGVQVGLAALLLLAISALCVLQFSQRPYLAIGWFWYLGTMVPVIGLVQVGIAAMAERYTYLPMIGPVVSVVWLVAEWAHPGRLRQWFTAGLGIAVLAACVAVTRWQLTFWQNSETLFERAIAVAPANVYANLALALGLEEQSRWREAATRYQILESAEHGHWGDPAAQFQVNYITNTPVIGALIELHYASVLSLLHDQRLANSRLEEALRYNPNLLIALNDLAWALATSPEASLRDGPRAVEFAERACQLTGYKDTHYLGTLAAAYAEAGRFDDAVATAQLAIANAQQKGETKMVAENQTLLQFYLKHQAFHLPQ